MSNEKKSASAKHADDTDNQTDAKPAQFITQRPILKEPSASAEDQSFIEKIPDESTDQKNQTGQGSITNIKIKPLQDTTVNTKDEEPVRPVEKTAPPNDEKPEAAVPADEPETEPAVKEAKTDGIKSEPEKDRTNLTVEELDAEAAEKQAKHDAAIQKLVDEKTYFLPINAVEKRRTKRFVVLGVALSVLLALAWFDVALDAGLIHVDGVKPVTHFFSN